MEYKNYAWLSLFLLTATLNPISIVWNFRIAQVTKQPIFGLATKQQHTVLALLFDEYIKKRSGQRQNFGGGLGAFIYDFDDYYVRIDAAVSHIKEVVDHVTTFSGTETDDLLFTLGRNCRINDKALVTVSGLLGLPTHKVYRLQHLDFGYSQVGLGLQVDGSYACTNQGDFLYGARYIYFAPRRACDVLRNRYKLTIGNVIDFLLAYKQTWNKHGLEVGYTSRTDFGAHICPNLNNFAEKTNYVRSSFYAVYKYKFHVNNVAHRFLFNISYGLDHKPKTFGDKYAITLWAAWDIGF